jgi:hypothetical protein
VEKKRKNLCIYLTALAAMIFPFTTSISHSYSSPRYSNTKHSNTQQYLDKKFESIVDSGLIIDTLWTVIAREGRSKNYDDLLPLDGGTVGIAHFAVGGLGALYDQMDTRYYFNRSKQFMKLNFSSKCRPKGKRGNDEGWGCYSKRGWRKACKNDAR